MGITINKLQKQLPTYTNPRTMKLQAITIALIALFCLSALPAQAAKTQRFLQDEVTEEDVEDAIGGALLGAALVGDAIGDEMESAIEEGLEELGDAIYDACIEEADGDEDAEEECEDLKEEMAGARFAFSLLAMAATVVINH